MMPFVFATPAEAGGYLKVGEYSCSESARQSPLMAHPEHAGDNKAQHHADEPPAARRAIARWTWRFTCAFLRQMPSMQSKP